MTQAGARAAPGAPVRLPTRRLPGDRVAVLCCKRRTHDHCRRASPSGRRAGGPGRSWPHPTPWWRRAPEVRSGLDSPERSRAYIGDMDLVSSGSRLRDLGLRVTDPRLSLLGDLTAAGPVRRVVAGRSPARRQTHIGDNQHHVVRRAHDAIEHIACVVGHDPFLKPSEDAGFERERTDVALLGPLPGLPRDRRGDARLRTTRFS
jgi:hypothetical protein